MVHVLSHAPFSSFSPSVSQSRYRSPLPFPSASPLASRRGLRLVCYALPRRPRQQHWKRKQHKENRRWHSEPDAVSTQEALHRFDLLLAAQNPPSSMHQFNQLFTALARTKTSSNLVFSLFTRLTQAEGIGPDEYTYAILMHYCARTNQVRLIFGFLGWFLKEGLRTDTWIFSSILKGLCREDKIDEATIVVLEKMPKMGCLPDVISYTILIDRLCKKGEIEKAMDFVDDMISKGHQPDEVTYNTLINGLCKKGKTKKAIDFLDDMISKGLQPDVVTCSTLIDGLCKNGEIVKAMNFLDDMIRKGHQPDVVTYNTLINALCKEGGPKKAKYFLDDMISKGHQPNVVTYNILINVLCKKGETRKAIDFLDDMISKGLEPDVVTCSTL